MALLKGVCLIIPDRFHADTFWDDMAATRATAMHYLGIIPPVLMKAPPGPQDRAHALRYGLGAGLDPALHVGFEARFGFPMVEVWGMTETGRFLADCHAPRQPHPRAFGRPLPGHLEAMVVDNTGQEVARGTAGELVVRAPGPAPRHGFFRGYMKDPRATAEAWRGGWFHTGDVVTQAPDGMLCFVERAKNLIRRSDENISAAEVEDALIDCPDVARVAVLSVPDPLRDEEVMAVVAPVGSGRNRGTAAGRCARQPPSRGVVPAVRPVARLAGSAAPGKAAPRPAARHPRGNKAWRVGFTAWGTSELCRGAAGLQLVRSRSAAAGADFHQDFHQGRRRWRTPYPTTCSAGSANGASAASTAIPATASTGPDGAGQGRSECRRHRLAHVQEGPLLVDLPLRSTVRPASAATAAPPPAAREGYGNRLAASSV